MKWCLLILALLFAPLPLTAGEFDAAQDNPAPREGKPPVGSGSGGRAVQAPSDTFKNDPDVDLPEDDASTQWLHYGSGEYTRYGRYSNNPGDRGWWLDAKGRCQSTFWDRSRAKAVCPACEAVAGLFNDAMSEFFFTKADECEAEEEKRRNIKAVQDALNRIRVLRDGNVQDAEAKALHQIEQIEAATQTRKIAIRRLLREREQRAQELARQLATCNAERCTEAEDEDKEEPKDDGIEVVIGGFGGWVPERTPDGVDTDLTSFPFNWRGPYATQCWQCEKLAAELNRMPPVAELEMEDLQNAQEHLIRLEGWQAMSDAYEGGLVSRGSDSKPFNAAAARRKRDQLEATIEEKRAALRRIGEHFNRVLQMLMDCEKRFCPALPQRKIGCVFPGNGRFSADGAAQNCSYDATLEYTVSITGSNPFDPYEIERIPDMIGGTDNTVPVVVVPPVTTPPVTTPPVTTPPVTTPPVTTPPVTTPPVTTTPLAVTASGSVSFAHTVGTSPCPQDAGTLTIASNNGNPLSVTGTVVTGTLASRLTITTISNGTASPRLDVDFNCSSATNGTFSGSVIATVQDTVTNETSSINVSGSGTVTGP